jgi:hypothetical protein
MQQCSEVELWGSNWILRTDLITGLIHWWVHNLRASLEGRAYLEEVGHWGHVLERYTLSLDPSSLTLSASWQT